MNLPTTKKFGISKSSLPNYLMELEYDEKNLNHINTLHASAIYSLAEISSGYFLNVEFSEYEHSTIPILRSSTMKYRKLCNSQLYSTAVLKNTTVEEIKNLLNSKSRVLFTIIVKLFDAENDLKVSGNFDWLVTMK